MEIKCPVTIGSYCYFNKKAGFKVKYFDMSCLVLCMDFMTSYKAHSAYTLKDYIPKHSKRLLTLSYTKVPYYQKGSPDYFRTTINRTQFVLDHGNTGY